MTDPSPTFRLKLFPAAAEACEVLDFIILLPCPFWAWVLFFYWKLWPFSHFSSPGPWPLTPFTSLAAKVRYLNIWTCLFSPLCCIRLRRPKVELCCGISKKTVVDRLMEPRSEWWNQDQEEWPAWIFCFWFWVPRIFETGRNATYTEHSPFFIYAQLFPNKYIIKYPLNGIPYLQRHVQLHNLN